MSNIKLCAFADESSPLIDGQIDALKRNGIEYLEIRNVDGDNVSLISADKAKSVYDKLNNAVLSILLPHKQKTPLIPQGTRGG